MKLIVSFFLLLLSAPCLALAQITAFQHIVIIVQENRTPDNLFQGLCTPPFGAAASCSASPQTGQYNIQTDNWLNENSPTGVTHPQALPLVSDYDLDHTHRGFLKMCDKDGTGACTMAGAANVGCVVSPGLPPPHPPCPPNPQFKFVDNSSGILNPYLELATRYGWANYMFQTNQGSSFPAHQYIFGGTSAPTAADDAAGIFVADTNGTAQNLGCTSPADLTAPLIEPSGEQHRIYPCLDHETIPDLLPSNFSWRYYSPDTGTIAIWNAPLAIAHICQSHGPGEPCTGPEWTDNVDSKPADVLKDIAACNLRSVSWVIPTGQNSDHATLTDGGGPSWVASIVNEIGSSTACDGGTGYWKNTAIFILWDDWGGWYDHEPARIRSTIQGDYERGFRVPLIVVSAYTPRHFISNRRLDFGSILRFIEHNFGITRGALNFADARSKRSGGGFFELNVARSFKIVDAPKTASFFLNDRRPALDPDDD
jgi:phospholipase C